MYSCIVEFQDGERRTQLQSHNPTAVTDYARNKVSRNPNIIKRVMVYDLTGPLETIWSADWEETNG